MGEGEEEEKLLSPERDRGELRAKQRGAEGVTLRRCRHMVEVGFRQIKCCLRSTMVNYTQMNH